MNDDQLRQIVEKYEKELERYRWMLDKANANSLQSACTEAAMVAVKLSESLDPKPTAKEQWWF